MKSIVISSLCVFLLGAVSPQIRAADDQAVQDASAEAARREAHKIDLKLKLADGIAAENRGAFVEASQLYTKCLDLVRQIGALTSIEPQYKAALGGFIATRTLIAEQAQRAGDFAAADAQYAIILKEDPKNEAVKQLRAKNEQFRVMYEGRRPDDAHIAQLGNIQTNRVLSATMAQNGKLLFESGKYDMAEVQLRQALKMDPDNAGADYYLKLTLDRKSIIAENNKELADRAKILVVEKNWAENTSREALPVPNMYARTNFVKTGQGRQKINAKLDAIKLDSVAYDGLPLNEVIKAIDKDALNRDPEKKGINFLLSTTADPQASAAPAIDPATGLPVAGGAAGGGEGDIGTTTIRIAPPQKDITLHQLLDILVLVADRPIKYSITDFGVVITLKGQETPTLYTRWYRIDPNTFMNGLQGVVALDFGGSGGGGGGGGGGFGGGGGGGGRGGGGGNRGGNQGGFGGGQGGQGQGSGSAEYASVSVAQSGARRGGQGGGAAGGARGGAGAPGGAGQAQGQGGGIEYTTVQTSQDVAITMVKSYFQTAGVDLNTPPKSVVFNDRLGMLMVRATLADLEMVEQAVQVLNMIPPQVFIQTKMAEVEQNDSKALGFNWLVGNITTANGKVGFQGGTAPSYNGRASTANPSGVFPGPLPPGAGPGSTVPGTVPPAATDNVFTSGLRNSAPAVATITGILTDPQFRLVINALEQREGVSFIASPSVLTPSGRQAQIKTVEIQTIVTDIDTGQTGGGGGGNTLNTTGGGGGVGSVIQPITEPFELGPSLDVVPYVSADGFTIQLTLIPTLKEFVGYDTQSGQMFAAQVQSVGGVGQASPPIVAPVPLPIFRLRQVVTSAIVWDGQTVALGGLIADQTTKIKDKVPVFGDLPIVGKLFRSESTVSKKKNLVIFVTPTIIDPSGNRVHTEDEMPFAQTAFPPQKPITQ